ncbi:DUF5708 family protein [Amycolatopsis aidingensis]|uniref:DUF5708 family protein n=1 Tax=Amycolatopsis aidingensis TaxID=2842453 RepID=UPI001C0ACD20|nr:DUF5708 family protein [Amycolatopsis aidingensis]
MSGNVKSLLAGALLLAIGLVLALTGTGVGTPIADLDKIGIVLALLGGIELVVTIVAMLRSSRRTADRG